MAKLCDICGIRPATVRAQVTTSDGESQVLDLCEIDYRRLARQQRSSSPLESLFGGRGSLFDEFFGDGLLGAAPLGSQTPASGTSIPIGGRARRGSDVEERLSEHARELLQAAARQASEFGRREVDTEHLLLALTQSDVVRTVFGQFKLSVDDLRQQVERQAPHGDAETGTSGEIGVTPRVKSALSAAFSASRDLGHSYVGPEHLLIGLAEEEEGIAGDILRRYGLTPQAIRQQVVKVIGRGAETGQVETPTNTPTLDKYARDLTKLAREGKLDPVIGRAREIETTIEVLARRKKNNPVLIGEPGVGKTAIVEGLAQRIVAGDVPENLREKRLVELSVNALVAGSKYRGEFEERVQQMLKEVTERQDQQILLISAES
jgi:ATP-dependent Clp protease ATP-binding subunit ClpC